MLKQFSDIVNKFSININTVNSKEDIRNDMWEMVIRVLKYYDYPNNKDISLDQIRGLIYNSLKNKIQSIVAHQALRLDTSDYSKVSLDDDYMVSNSDYTNISINNKYQKKIERKIINLGIGDLKYYSTVEDFIIGNELVYLLVDWANKQDKLTKDFIMNILSPTKEIAQKWEEDKKKYKRLRFYETIPPFTVARYMGISKTHTYKILDKMSKYLIKHGYIINNFEYDI